MYGFIANEETSVLPAIEEQHHGSMFIFISTKAEANWMQMAPTTQLGAGASFFFFLLPPLTLSLKVQLLLSLNMI